MRTMMLAMMVIGCREPHWEDAWGNRATEGPAPVVFGEEGEVWTIDVQTGRLAPPERVRYDTSIGCVANPVIANDPGAMYVFRVNDSLLYRPPETPVENEVEVQAVKEGLDCNNLLYPFPVLDAVVYIREAEPAPAPPAVTWDGPLYLVGE